MKKLTGFFFAGLTVAVLAGGCSQGKKESAEPIPQTKTKADKKREDSY